MMLSSKYGIVLSIYPNSRGFAYVAFEGPLAPVAWSVADVRSKEKNKECIRRIAKLLNRLCPVAVVLPNASDHDVNRAARVRGLNQAIVALAETHILPVFAYSTEVVRACFVEAGVKNKQVIAETIAKHIPAFERYLPSPRKPWRSEASSMGLFDAAALGFAFFYQRGLSVGPSA